ncbi:MAG: YSIRK-type signal peptide-containing protein, partial [Lactobacillus sp.]|nr:YSIRK-type signal peptide-containing protein [Lactobacillus sp.]
MKKNRLLDSADHRQHFSLRKLSIGTVSVLLGTTLYLGGGWNQRISTLL